MKFKIHLVVLAMWISCIVPAMAAAADQEWDVDGTRRTGIVCVPDAAVRRPAAGWPAVFVFHGHGGSARQIRRQFKTDTLWPEAVVIYLQGLPTVGQLTDKNGDKPGWDSINGAEKNKDIRLYDVVLKDLIDHQHIDPKRVFSTGHSNGGGFSFTLWAYRGDTLAAIASSSSVASLKEIALLKPKPAFMSSGRNDPLVKFEWQTKMSGKLKTLNGITGDGKAWGTDGTWFSSENKTPLATIVYDGAHAPPADIGQRVVDFFKTVSPGDGKTK